MSSKAKTKTKASTTKVEGAVERKVDFNLKKEDLMLLIVEGRREGMEQIISELTTAKTEVYAELEKRQKTFREALEKQLMELFTKEARDITERFPYEDGGEPLSIQLDELTEHNGFSVSAVSAIKNDWNEKVGSSASVKTTKLAHVVTKVYQKAEFRANISFGNKVYISGSTLLKSPPAPCTAYGNGSSFKLAVQQLNLDIQRGMTEYKALLETVEKVKDVESKLSDVTTEYALFSTNKERAKAAMIKEVLAVDVNGQALLNNIQAAAKGVKLLS